MPFLREFLELKADNLGRCLAINFILQQASVKTRILAFVMVVVFFSFSCSLCRIPTDLCLTCSGKEISGISHSK